MSAVRRNIMLGTAGHVDHGKSALVKLLTGCETDTLAEEKQRGLTIDLGFAPCQLEDKRIVGIVDVPGHVDFIRNMVAGAHGIDVVIFVVAADDGIMPQTHEHLHILTLMGLRHGLVALTKVDLVDAARREFVTQDVGRMLAGTFLAHAPICPMSGITGEGFDTFFDALNKVVDLCGDRACTGQFRVWVEDAFAIRGAGAVVTGIPTHGRVRAGDRLHLLPAGLSSNVRSLQVYGANATEGRAGECVALNVPELDHTGIRRGAVLSGTNQLSSVTMFEAELEILPGIKATIEDYREVQLHVGTAACAAHLAMLEFPEMTGGQRQFVQLRLSEPLPVLPGDRFVVRTNLTDAGGSRLMTVGGGQILSLSNTRLRRKKQWTLDQLANRRAAVGQPLAWCELMLRESRVPLSAAKLQLRCFARGEEVDGWLKQLQSQNRVVATAGGAWLHREVVQETAAQVLGALEAFHKANAQRAGLSRDELFAELKVDPQLLALAVASLTEGRQIEQSGAFLAKAGWSARLSDRDQQLSEQIAARLKQAAWSPPSLEELAATLGQPVARINTLARLLAERGIVVRLDDRIWMHRDAVEAGKESALKLFRKAPGFSTMDFRDALGVSRKYAVPLVDHLDRVRFTVRSGNNRTPGVEAKKLLDPNHIPQN